MASLWFPPSESSDTFCPSICLRSPWTKSNGNTPTRIVCLFLHPGSSRSISFVLCPIYISAKCWRLSLEWFPAHADINLCICSVLFLDPAGRVLTWIEWMTAWEEVNFTLDSLHHILVCCAEDTQKVIYWFFQQKPLSFHQIGLWDKKSVGWWSWPNPLRTTFDMWFCLATSCLSFEAALDCIVLQKASLHLGWADSTENPPLLCYVYLVHCFVVTRFLCCLHCKVVITNDIGAIPRYPEIFFTSWVDVLNPQLSWVFQLMTFTFNIL